MLPGNLFGSDYVDESGKDSADKRHSFKHHIGREAQEKETLEATNFDLKLQLQRMTQERDEALKQSVTSRRATKDGFYDFRYSDDSRDDNESASAVDRERSRVEAKCKQEIETARAETATARKQARLLDKNMKELQREKNGLNKKKHNLSSELAEEKSAVISMTSEITEANATVKRAYDEISQIKGSTASVPSVSVPSAMTAEGLKIQLHTAEAGLKEERAKARKVQSEGKLWRKRSTVAKTQADRVEEDQSESLRRRATGSSSKDGDRAEVERINARLNSLRLRHDALEDEINARKYLGKENVSNPLGAGNEGVDLSVPGFSLYNRLVKKIQAMRGMPIRGKMAEKQWRSIVLKEMNSSLLMLYRQVEKLEGDRRTFIDKYCTVLKIDDEKYLRGEESNRIEH